MDKKTSFWKKVRTALGFKGSKSPRVVIYARVSTDGQARKPGVTETLDRKLDRVKKWGVRGKMCEINRPCNDLG